MLAINMIGVPIDIGARKSGAKEGPAALKAFGMPEKVYNHLRGEVPVIYRNVRETWARDVGEEAVEAIFNPQEEPSPPVYYKKEVAMIAERAGVEVYRALHLGKLPVVLGGDHSVSDETLGTAAKFYMRRGESVSLLWIDAHLDAHTPQTSHSHNANGMPLALLILNRASELVRINNRSLRPGLSPSRVLHVGAGNSHCEDEEKAFFVKHKIKSFDMEMLIRRGGWDAFFSVFATFAKRFDRLLVSLDLDAIHKHWAPGVTLPSLRGMLGPEVLALADCVRETGKLGHLEIMEYNPRYEELDPVGVPRTAAFATELLCRFLR